MIATSALAAEAIRERLTDPVVGPTLYVYGEVDSTNARLGALARSGAPEGTAVLADGQTAGRGRHGQPWFSPGGVNLYASVLFRPRVDPADLAVFAFIASLGLADAVRDAGPRPGIKWPNDVMVAGKKVGGALVECAMRGEAIEHVILGVGVNLNVDTAVLQAALGPAGRFATSLSAVVGHAIDRNAFAASYLNHLGAWARRWETLGPDAIRQGWADRDILSGRRVEARGPAGAVMGRALGVDARGALVVEDPLGRRHALVSEEVRMLD